MQPINNFAFLHGYCDALEDQFLPNTYEADADVKAYSLGYAQGMEKIMEQAD
jgi:hypothetical protein